MKTSVIIFLAFITLCFSKANTCKADSFPVFDHVVIVVLENHSYNQIIGGSYDSFINFLADSGALFTKFYSETHPSQPNYIILYSGSNQGVKDDMMPMHIPFMTQNLGAALISAKPKRTFNGFAENLPHIGYPGNDSLTNYARRHCPWVNWQASGMALGPNQIDSTNSLPFTNFPSNFKKLPTVCFVIPNTTNDMHDGTGTKIITTGDNWIKNNFGNYVKWTKANKSLLIITFDEDDDKSKNHIPTIFYGAQVVKGKYKDSINHYNILATLQKMYNLKPFGDSAKAKNMAIVNCWDTGQKIIDTTVKDTTTKDTTVTGIHSTNAKHPFSIYPNPASTKIYIHGLDLNFGKAIIRVYDINGKLLNGYKNISSIDVSSYKPGSYFIEIEQNGTIERQQVNIAR